MAWSRDRVVEAHNFFRARRARTYFVAKLQQIIVTDARKLDF